MLTTKEYLASNDFHILPHLNIALLDIETDGLSHKNKIVIIGLIIRPSDHNHPILYQWFNDDGLSEKDILSAFLSVYETYKIHRFITFNGNSFDIPFINARLNAHHFHQQLFKATHIDLLKLARQNKHYFNSSSLSLKSIEKAFGIHREDTISGKESVALYKAYLLTRHEKTRDIICLHNREDIINMIPLLKLLEQFPSDLVLEQRHPLEFQGKLWFITDYHITGSYLNVYLGTAALENAVPCFIETTSFYFHCEHQMLHLKLPLKTLSAHLVTMDTVLYCQRDMAAMTDEEKTKMIIYFDSEWYFENMISLTQNTLAKIDK